MGRDRDGGPEASSPMVSTQEPSGFTYKDLTVGSIHDGLSDTFREIYRQASTRWPASNATNSARDRRAVRRRLAPRQGQARGRTGAFLSGLGSARVELDDTQAQRISRPSTAKPRRRERHPSWQLGTLGRELERGARRRGHRVDPRLESVCRGRRAGRVSVDLPRRYRKATRERARGSRRPAWPESSYEFGRNRAVRRIDDRTLLLGTAGAVAAKRFGELRWPRREGVTEHERPLEQWPRRADEAEDRMDRHALVRIRPRRRAPR